MNLIVLTSLLIIFLIPINIVGVYAEPSDELKVEDNDSNLTLLMIIAILIMVTIMLGENKYKSMKRKKNLEAD